MGEDLILIVVCIIRFKYILVQRDESVGSCNDIEGGAALFVRRTTENVE